MALPNRVRFGTIGKTLLVGMRSIKNFIIQADGSCQGNPGPAAIGVVIKSGNKVYRISKFIGNATNNMAEYQALLYGLQLAKRLQATSVEVMMDSELVLKQLQGKYKVRQPRLLALHKKARDLLAAFPQFSLRKVSRDENSEAHVLALKALRTLGL